MNTPDSPSRSDASTRTISTRLTQRLLIPLATLGVALPCAQAAQHEITTNFPGGNVVVVSNAADLVVLRADLRGGSDWFYWHFAVEAAAPGAVKFAFPGLMKVGVRGPAVSLDDGATWNWLGAESVRIREPSSAPWIPGTQDSFVYTFAAAGQRVRFAVGIPYLRSNLDAFLAAQAGNAHLAQSVLATTSGGREVPLLRIGEPGPGRRAMIAIARSHACESMASYVLEGVMAEALSDSAAAADFRDRHVLYVVPLLDADGVEAGDQGKGRAPHDHNRDYGATNLYAEVAALQTLAADVDVAFMMDFHCPTLNGEAAEGFYFDGWKLPHNNANLEELRAWMVEEQPSVFGTFAPSNFMKAPPETFPENGMPSSHYFATLPGVLLSTTLEVPYSQTDRNLDADLARAVGRGLLAAWTRVEFKASGDVLDGGLSADLAQLRADFLSSYRPRPADAQALLDAVLADPDAAAPLKVEATLLYGTLRASQKVYADADARFQAVYDDPIATAAQRTKAAVQRAQALFANVQATEADRTASVLAFEALPYRSTTYNAQVYGAASACYQAQQDWTTAFGYAQSHLLNTTYRDRAAVLIQIAAIYDGQNNTNAAIQSRQEAVDFLRSRMPFEGSIFGATMAGDMLIALYGIPTSTAEERAAARTVFETHPVTSPTLKAQVEAAIAKLPDYAATDPVGPVDPEDPDDPGETGGDDTPVPLGAKVWSGGGEDNTWSAAANWGGGVAPISAESLFFTGSARRATTNDLKSAADPLTVSALTFARKAGAFTLSGNPVKPSTTLTISSHGSRTQTIALDIADSAFSTLWQPESGLLAMKGAITSSRGADTLIQDARGALILQGALNFTAAAPGLQVRNGTVLVDLAAGASVTNTTRLTLGNSQAITDAKLDEDRQSATIVVRGKPTGASQVSFSGITVNPEASMARIVVDPNGGAGTTLAFGPGWTMPFTMRTSGLHVDLSRPGAEVSMPFAQYKNGSLNYSVIVPSFTVRDATGTTGFAVTNATGGLARNTALTEFHSGGAVTAGASYVVTGDASIPGGRQFWALSARGSGALTLESYAVINGLVMEEGSGDFTVSGGATARLGMGSTHTFYIHQHSLAGSLVYDCLMLGEYMKMGPGKLILKRATESTSLNESVLRVIEGEVEVQGVLPDATRIHRVFGGGTLSGSGRIASSVTVHPGGTLDGSHVSTNALTIGGALKLKRGSSLAVDLGSQTHEALQVAGAVTNEGADMRLALAERPRVGVPLTLVASGTAISAPFSTVNGAALGPAGDFSLDYDGESFKFVLEQTVAQAAAVCVTASPTLPIIR